MALVDLHDRGTSSVNVRSAGHGDLLGTFINTFDTITKAYDISRQRLELLGLDEHQLKDIGVSKTQAKHEANRHFWDLP